jgi:hypothetical protein
MVVYPRRVFHTEAAPVRHRDSGPERRTDLMMLAEFHTDSAQEHRSCTGSSTECHTDFGTPGLSDRDWVLVLHRAAVHMLLMGVLAYCMMQQS